MGSSAKRKKEKQKDFQKPQLKVGKTKPKASNFTDTSFKAKSIVVGKQSIAVAPPSAPAQFAHYVSSLKHRSDSQRTEALSYLTNSIASCPATEPLLEPVAILLPKLLPLVLDGSNAVRQQLLKLLNSLMSRRDEVRPLADRALLYVHAAMSHLSSDIRTFAVEILDWLMTCAGQEAISCAGGWIKTLNCFLGLFGWSHTPTAPQTAPKPPGWTSVRPSGNRTGGQTRHTSRALTIFARFLHKGLVGAASAEDTVCSSVFPIHHVRAHMVTSSSNAFGHLNLFGAPRDEENEVFEDREERQRVFRKSYHDVVQSGVGEMIREGGEVGRAAAGVRKTLSAGSGGNKTDDDDSDLLSD